jgi:allantoicase
MEFTSLIDLASERLGGAVLLANDEFFAPKENLIRASAPEWREGEYTERGKWMDGWETRRRREPGHDWCIIRLGRAGRIRGVVVDTSWFTGNYPESCAIEGCAIEDVSAERTLADGDVAWTEVLPRSPLRGDGRNEFEVRSEQRFTHLRFSIFPDGGVARLHVHGEVLPDWPRILRGGGEVDLGALEHGGRVVSCSDMHYGNPQNMLMPGQPAGMHDGWETKRRRGPGHDWAIVRLGAPGTIRRVVVDTSHFKGNAPGSCTVEATRSDDEAADAAAWRTLLPQTPLMPHTVHDFVGDVSDAGLVTHVRLNIHPDGGVARLRLFGVPDANSLPAHGARSDVAREKGIPAGDTLPDPAGELPPFGG